MERGQAEAPWSADTAWQGGAGSWTEPPTTAWSVEALYPSTTPARRWYQRRGAQVSGAALAGLLAGLLLGGGDTDALQESLMQERDRTRQAVEGKEQAEAEREDALVEASQARAAASEAQGVAAAVQQREGELTARADELAAQGAALAAREAELSAREATVAAAELAPPPSAQTPAETSIPSTSRGATVPGAYANCSAARAAGGAPVYAGEPGYGSHLDRDGDGVGCE